MGRVFADPFQHEAARVIVGVVTARPDTPEAAETVALQLGANDLNPTEVAAGAALLVGRILDDVSATFRLDRADTVETLGRWIAADEFAGDDRG